MKKRTLVLSLGYWFSAYSLGLLVHPYKTMRQLVRERVFLPLMGLPVVLWLMGWLVGMIGSRVVLWLEVEGMVFEGLRWGGSFLFVWGSGFLFLWQVMLVYLLVRFWKVLG